MRTMFRWTVPVERGNEAIKDGTLAKTIQTLMDQLKPEAAYFMPTAMMRRRAPRSVPVPPSRRSGRRRGGR